MPPETIDVEALAESLTTKLSLPGSNLDKFIQEQIAAGVSAKLEELGVITQMTKLQEQMAAGLPDPAVNYDPKDPIAWANPHKHSKLAPGYKLDGKFDDFHDFMSAVVLGTGADRLLRIPDEGDIKAALEGENLHTGGALVPEEFRAQLFELALQPTSIRSMATVLPMGATQLSLPSVRDTSHASGTVYGGVRTFWLARGKSITESQPTFARVELTAKGLLCLTSLDNFLINDSAITLVPLIGRMFMGAQMWEEERTFIRGDGAGEPLGILNSDAMVEVTRNTDSETGEIDVTDLGKMEARLLPECDPFAVYMINPAVRQDLYGLAKSSVQFWHEDLSQPMPMTLNGRRVIVNEHCSARGTRGDIILADWRMYLIGDRMAQSMMASEHAAFQKVETMLRGVSRLDGQPWLEEPLTPAQGTETLSPFVTLN